MDTFIVRNYLQTYTFPWCNHQVLSLGDQPWGDLGHTEQGGDECWEVEAHIDRRRWLTEPEMVSSVCTAHTRRIQDSKCLLCGCRIGHLEFQGPCRAGYQLSLRPFHLTYEYQHEKIKNYETNLSRHLAKPKSPIFNLFSQLIKILAGFKSRWIIFNFFMWFMADANSKHHSRRIFSWNGVSELLWFSITFPRSPEQKIYIKTVLQAIKVNSRSFTSMTVLHDNQWPCHVVWVCFMDVFKILHNIYMITLSKRSFPKKAENIMKIALTI